MPKKLQSDDDDLMKIFEHYAELRRENAEYEDTVRTLECDIASLQGRVEQLEELNKQLTEERDQFLERYYRLVTQFELMGGSFDRARAGITDAIGYLRRRPEKHDHREIPALPAAKSLGSGNGLEDGIAKIAAALEGERLEQFAERSRATGRAGLSQHRSARRPPAVGATVSQQVGK